LGVFFIPLSVANAGFFSSILGSRAEALGPLDTVTDNSQKMALLEADMSHFPILKESNGSQKESSFSSEDNTPRATDNIASGNALVPSTSMFDVVGGPDMDADFELSPDDMSIYVVRSGDTLSEIAEMFDVSVNTILWANDLKKSSKIAEGDILFILPVSGVRHIVAKGETLKSIAGRYKVDIETITIFNDMAAEDKLVVGDELIIPDGVMPEAPSSPKSGSPKGSSPGSILKNVVGYFINPVPEFRRKSQDLHGPGNRGVDLAAPTGTRIFASASGRVSLARKGYNGGYGNMVIIEHPNGTKTLYAHMSKLGITTGAQVSQGEVIGYVGSTGRSTGPHLHFEVFNAKNPGADWSWAN